MLTYDAKTDTFANTPHVFESLLDQRLRYAYDRGPQQVQTFEDALHGGLSCAALVKLALRELGIETEPTEDAYEMWWDVNSRFVRLDGVQPRTGDLAWFGRTCQPEEFANFKPEFEAADLLNWSEFPVQHVGIHFDSERVLHISDRTGSPALWTPNDFAQDPRYSATHGLSRPRQLI